MNDPDKAASPDRLKVTVSDVATGEVLGEQIIYDDYLVVCAGHPYLAHTQAHANGTHVLTIKQAGRPRPTPDNTDSAVPS